MNKIKDREYITCQKWLHDSTCTLCDTVRWHHHAVWTCLTNIGWHEMTLLRYYSVLHVNRVNIDVFD